MPTSVIHNLNSQIISTTNYVRGNITLQGSNTVWQQLESVYNAIDTRNKNTIVDIFLENNGKFRVTGYLYNDKSYGCLEWISYSNGTSRHGIKINNSTVSAKYTYNVTAVS